MKSGLRLLRPPGHNFGLHSIHFNNRRQTHFGLTTRAFCSSAPPSHTISRMVHQSGSEVVVVGTWHGSKWSEKDVCSAIASVKPQVVLVELDAVRLVQLRKLHERKGGSRQAIEFYAAVTEAEKIGAKLVLGDWDFPRLVKRVFEKAFNFETLSGLGGLLTSTPTAIANNVKGASMPPSRAVADQDNDRLRKHVPLFYEVLVTERDKHMAQQLYEHVELGQDVVVVVGLAHMAGIEGHLARHNQKWVPPPSSQGQDSDTDRQKDRQEEQMDPGDTPSSESTSAQASSSASTPPKE